MRFVFIYESFINWLHAKFNNRQFLIFSSILVGLSAGMAAIVLKLLVHYIHFFITKDYHAPIQKYLTIFFPLVGILLTVYFVQRFLKGKLGRGNSNVLYSIVKKSGFLPKDQMYSHVLTSALTVGFGGSAGLESPMVTTGSAIGSNYARTYHLGYKDRLLLLAAGAAAGIAAAFNSPIAGVLFALEVLLVDVTISAFIPLMIASATGALCAKIVLHDDILLSFRFLQPFDFHFTLYYVVLGVFAGLVSVYYTRTFLKVEKLFAPKKGNAFLKALTGGLLLAGLLLLFPSLLGEGYNSIKFLSEMKAEKLLDGSVVADFTSNKWMLLFFVGAVMLVKVFATAITIGSGGNGGNFAPSLFVGAYLGYFFSRLVNMLGISKLPEGNFTVVAMSGILTGVFHAPLTGIFLIAEITGGYELMIPLMIVSAISYTVVKYFEPLSIDASKLAKKGHAMPHDKDKTILASIKAARMVENDFQSILPEATLGKLVDVVAHSTRNIFPVVDADNKLQGIILLDNIREIMFKTEMYEKVSAKQLMRKPQAVISPEENMSSAMKKFEETHTWNLPVVDDAGVYVGFISKSNIFTKYRKLLIRSTKE